MNRLSLSPSLSLDLYVLTLCLARLACNVGSDSSTLEPNSELLLLAATNPGLRHSGLDSESISDLQSCSLWAGSDPALPVVYWNLCRGPAQVLLAASAATTDSYTFPTRLLTSGIMLLALWGSIALDDKLML